MATVCIVCGKEIGFLSNKACVKVGGDEVEVHFDPCYKLFQNDPKKFGGKSIDYHNSADALKSTEVSGIKLTTAFGFTNYIIEDEVGIVTSECVFGMNVFRDFFSGMTDFFGGRSQSSQKVLRDARETCLNELKKEAYDLGADGVIGIDLDYQEISGKGKGMLFLVASGTAVKFQIGTNEKSTDSSVTSIRR